VRKNDSQVSQKGDAIYHGKGKTDVEFGFFEFLDI
jgi:hypothetical protein